MVDETVQQDAPEEGTQETPEQQAQREESEGQLQEGQQEQPEGSEHQEDGEDAAAKRAKRVQKRIDQLTKQRHEALREAEKLREENQKLKEQQTVQPPADDPRPSFDEYASVEQYQQEYDQWARRQAKREAEATQQPSSGQSVEEQEAIDRIENAAIEASDRYPDFEQVVYDPKLPLTQEMVRAAAETDHVADVLYHLGKNREEAQRLSQMSGTSLVREIGRLEARLEGNPQGQDQSTSAPDPIQTVQGSRAKREPRPSEMSVDQWMEWRQKQLAEKRR